MTATFRRFKTFTQELRLQGTAFDDRLDWLVGGYYANEKLQGRATISRFGNAVRRVRNACRDCVDRPSAPASAIAASRSAGSRAASRQRGRRPIARRHRAPGAVAARCSAPAGAGRSSPARSDRLEHRVNDARRRTTATPTTRRAATGRCSPTTSSTSPTQIDLTVGLRYTHEKQEVRSRLRQQQHRLRRSRRSSPFLRHVRPRCRPAACRHAILTLPGQFDRALNDVSTSRTTRGKRVHRARLCCRYKPTDDLLTLRQLFARLQGRRLQPRPLRRSKSPIRTVSRRASAARRRWLDDLQFDPEINDAFELGAKYTRPRLRLQRRRCSTSCSTTSSSTRSTARASSSRTSTAASDDLDGADAGQSSARRPAPATAQTTSAAA